MKKRTVSKYRYFSFFKQILVFAMAFVGIIFSFSVTTDYLFLHWVFVAFFLIVSVRAFRQLFQDFIALKIENNQLELIYWFGLKKLRFHPNDILECVCLNANYSVYGVFYSVQSYNYVKIKVKDGQSFELKDYNYSNFQEIRAALFTFL